MHQATTAGRSVSAAQEHVYSCISSMMDAGMKRSHAIRAYAAQSGRPIDSVRRDFNRFTERLEKKEHQGRAEQNRSQNQSPVISAHSWKTQLERLRCQHELLTVMHLCDIHFPFHHAPALELAYAMVALHQPHVVVIGSDQFDLDLMSSFEISADRWDATPDILDSLRTAHFEHVRRIKAAAPNALLLFIDGNHEERYRRWVNDNAPKLRATLNRIWEDMIRADNQVHYIGEREVEICAGLFVRHGDRHNVHAARSLIEQEGYQVSVIAGHTHKPQTYHAQGRRYGVVGATSGCLSTLTPKYLHGKPSGWKHGTIVARVHHPTGYTAVENVVFAEDKRSIFAVTGSELLRIKK